MGGQQYEPATVEVDFGGAGDDAYGAQPVEIGPVDPEERQTALILNVVFLIVGVFFFPVWAAGFFYKNHPDPTVKLLAKINLGLFILVVALMCCFFILTIVMMLIMLVIFVIMAILGVGMFAA
eukprot:CAMPEP_0114618664 /NCGR_PEP_ID=MMETSP0168-20121206/7815_1 /TAXON_ID=95228 ORGANISM="Vannella sp., Strain DIVA3 517/6/12" /NCGR_SAMPLE_ID=MMETSP0168 /ASSEMBLY_ACC=CAM_ASM_000044 /LENGTH=122 /DNA_ID=CAMNT_0001829809 /DNA_START=57 /DNA_END=422 /DNA_ORIENTATION=-